MHPVFYSLGGTLPNPGNIIEVDFPDDNNKSYGTYLRIINSEGHPVVSGPTAEELLNGATFLTPVLTLGPVA
jgi:hypothetical protein